MLCWVDDFNPHKTFVCRLTIKIRLIAILANIYWEIVLIFTSRREMKVCLVQIINHNITLRWRYSHHSNGPCKCSYATPAYITATKWTMQHISRNKSSEDSGRKKLICTIAHIPSRLCDEKFEILCGKATGECET